LVALGSAWALAMGKASVMGSAWVSEWASPSAKEKGSA
jgi:hypothetical protein